MTGRVFTRISALVAIFSLALALPAFAQTTVSPTTDAYGGPQSQVLGNFDGGGQNDVVPPPAAPSAPASGEADTPSAPATTPTERGVDTPTPSVATGELPFTGFEAGLVALFGALLLGTGFAMRRASRTTA